LWLLFLNRNSKNMYFGIRGYSGSYDKYYFEDNALFTTEPYHLAITWTELGKIEDCKCKEWTPERGCQEGDTFFTNSCWEYDVKVYKMDSAWA
jgi:hypothetical protein